MVQISQMLGQIDQLALGLNALHAQVHNLPAAVAAPAPHQILITL
jgi:hypothetical protein